MITTGYLISLWDIDMIHALYQYFLGNIVSHNLAVAVVLPSHGDLHRHKVPGIIFLPVQHQYNMTCLRFHDRLIGQRRHAVGTCDDLRFNKSVGYPC